MKPRLLQERLVWTLGGASATFDTFASVMSTNDTTYYAIVHTANGTDEWEVGLGGTYSGTNTLARTTVLSVKRWISNKLLSRN